MTLATAYCTYVNWPFSFLLPALVIPFLALPIPSAPSLRYGLWITTKLIAFAGLGTVLMLPLHSHQLFGFAVVALILFVNFYLQAEGKITSLNAMIVIVGITLVPAFGENSLDTGVEFAKGMSQCALAMFPILWVAFAALPGGVFPGLPNAPRIEGTPADRGILALRPVLVLLPLFAYMLSSDNNIRYLIGYYQPAMISQHARRATALKLTVDLILATLIGATGGLIMWWLDQAVAVVVLVRAGDGAVLAFLRYTHLRQRTRRADAELLPVELWPDDAGLHRLSGCPDAGLHRRRCEHEVLRAHRRLRAGDLVLGLRHPALRRGRGPRARIAQETGGDRRSVILATSDADGIERVT